MLPLRACVVQQSPVLPGVILNVGKSRRDFPRVAASAHLHLQQLLPLSPAGLARYRQGELLNPWWRMLIRSIIFTCALSRRWGRFCGDYGGDSRVKFP